MLLATDLDGTFLAGKPWFRQQLYQLIRESKSMQLVFVTGRSLETVIPFLNDPVIPNPDYIICDVGSTIVSGYTLEPVWSLQTGIGKKWPGSQKIRESLDGIENIEYQETPQQGRCSFFTTDESVVEQVRSRVQKLDCDVIFSANKFLDVLPGNVNKGTTLALLVNYLEIEKTDVLVAGDTVNDLAMYECGFKGVIVGNAEEKLITATRHLPDIFYAGEAGAGGIIESLEHFNFLSQFIYDKYAGF
jgi:HAD superfamily hydrolase (TIGR01484 family)